MIFTIVSVFSKTQNSAAVLNHKQAVFTRQYRKIVKLVNSLSAWTYLDPQVVFKNYFFQQFQKDPMENIVGNVSWKAFKFN